MSESRSLDSLFQLVHLLKRQYQNKMEQLDIGITPMHMGVLKVIRRNPQCTAIDVSNFLNRDKSQVTRLLNSLIKDGIIEKELNPADKRSHYLRITSSGEKIMEQIAGVDSQMDQLITKNLSPEELEEFQRLAGKVAKGLRD
ncbi:MarR family transcriptional regulator [Vibrio sp. JC009]|uniref:MarR family winged helix-turn-helix transcriptional regulator n=1 Tax=Vibrio sp. JC009 TaxID=2912314 RepID=UPI0023B0D476|nr:MarR family transcriptional regulator [Vibrio sp. JC009]WED23031.1 MarR family transcriptional regulator [Vibrio sp. JC009]